MKPPFQLYLLAVILCLCHVCTADQKPNVLLILVDDLKPTLGCYGDPIAITPNLDRLASRGLRFDLAYCNQAVCAPSRFTLMLGSHSTSTGLYGLGSNLRKTLPNVVTLPQYFAKHGGYRTESLGKVFHVGHGNQGDPASFSTEHFHDKVIEYVDAASTRGGQLTREEAYFTNQKLNQIRSLPRGAAFESPDVDDSAYADGRIANETVKRLRAAKQRLQANGTPFFITVGFARPHLPFSAPKKYWDLFDPEKLPLPEFEKLPAGSPKVAHKRGGEICNYFPVPDHDDYRAGEPIPPQLKRDLIHGYYASTSFVDAQIGTVLAELDRLELAKDTIVVLWGDHGFHLGDLGIWTKHTNYEQANRIPILIAAPGITQPGSSTKQLTESVDLFPTLAELAGLPAPQGPQPIDGLSLVPVLKDPRARIRDHAYHAYPKKKIGRAIRTQRYRLVEWCGFNASPESAEYELYDYETDPLETENFAAKKPEVVARLKQTLASYPRPVQRNAKPQEAASAKSTLMEKTPFIANRSIQITAQVNSPNPRGVVVAQGGVENGYSLHFVNANPALDVRISGNVTRLLWPKTVKGLVKLGASLDKEKMSLSVNGEPELTQPSPGLIPVQPKDRLSLGRDVLSPAGNYKSPNPFNGKIVSHRIDVVAPKVAMRTPWGEQVTEANVWTEYPRPALRRDQWTNLNGYWQYAVRPDMPGKQWDGKILVPFAIEAPLSGVEKRFTPDDVLWYRRVIHIEKINPDRRYKLNFEAVDYKSTVWVNGNEIGSNTGGNLPFSFDVTDALQKGENEIMLRVTDATDSGYQLHGKQRLEPKGIWYTPVSGIWQTVWMEEVPQTHVTGLKITPRMDGSVRIETQFNGPAKSTEVKVTASLNKQIIATASGSATDLLLKIPNPKLWSPNSPVLYDLQFEFGDDVVTSYVGIRETGRARDENGHLRFTLNGKPIFHWGTLDQGWWPDGLLTPPSDQAMVSDIDFLKAAGFNTIRKHIKVEPRRYYYHCDRLGMMIWQDQVSARRTDDPKWIRSLQPAPPANPWPAAAHAQFMAEFKRMIDTLYSHPSIVQWVPFNERWGQHQTMEVGQWAVTYDPTRDVNIASGGNFFPIGHIADEHRYPHPEFPFEEQSDGRLADFVKVMGEFGGHGFPVEGHLWSTTTRNWGYGGLPKDKNEWLERYRTSIRMLAELKQQGIAAGIYTQTTDVEGEINGLITYDRKVQKIPPAKLAEIHRAAGLISRPLDSKENRE